METKQSLCKVFLCTFCMVGVIFTWTVEIAYGTPFLLSLNLSKELTAVVWLAGPISGFLVQPIVGAVSDTCTFRLGRRRPFIIMGGILVLASLVCISYSKELASLSGSPNPETIRHWTVVIAITSFYILDFSLNAVQASCRSLMVDTFCMDQQELVTAFASNLGNMTNVFGYFTGYVDLVKYFPSFLGGGTTQMKALCNIGVIVFMVSVSVTCLTVHEKRYSPPLSLESPSYDDNRFFIGFLHRSKKALLKTVKYIWTSVRQIPLPIKRICHVQFFAWLGWFPFLIYSSTWVSGLYYQEHPEDRTLGNWEKGTRAGSFALLIYAIVAMVSGIVFPWLTNKRYLSMKTVYTGSHLIYGITMIFSYWIQSVMGATAAIGIVGISWACSMWIPYALVGEYLYLDNHKTNDRDDNKLTGDNNNQEMQSISSSSSCQSITMMEKSSVPVNDSGIITVEIKSSTTSNTYSDNQSSTDRSGPDNTGMALGIVNIFVVLPQFLVAVIAALIFMIRQKYLEQANQGANSGGNDSDVVGVAWVLEFGSWMAFIAAALSRRLIDV
ncbi:major facilitator superfamily domain-containing protein [Chlamydoabsidia padenii]|nr:major facilitator superfamily domain-containing protein [Chlamydoabsidia padenii]